MNAQKLNQKSSRLSYQKDYTKLESIFDAAVERMHRKKIIYYATDRIYSEDSRKIRARETFKETAWAKPVSAEDIKTEVIQLAKENVIPISDTILNDDPSLISFLELVGEDNIEMVETVENEEALEQSIIKEEEVEEPQKVEAVELKDLFELEEAEKPTENIELETTSEAEQKVEAVKLADLIPESEEEPTIKEKAKPENNSLFQRYQKLKAEIKAQEKEKVFQEETLIKEESATEETGIEEQIEFAPESTEEEVINEVEEEPEELNLFEAEEAEESGDYLEADYDKFLEFSNQVLENENIPEDMTLSELLASIQEDDSYLSRDDTTESQVAEVETEIELFEEESELDSVETPAEEVAVTIEEKPLDEFKEETMQVQESPLDVELKETKPRRRIQLDEVETQDLYNPNLKLTESETKQKKLSQGLIDKVNGAKKEYMLSRISFFIALFMTGVFIVLFIQSFNGIDYFSLVLSLVGTFLVWDLTSKRILIMTGVIEAAVIASMIYMTNTTGMPLDYFHYIWLLIVPVLICSSFIFKKSRENYASIVNGKDVNLETN